jgi:hypothetical protein
MSVIGGGEWLTLHPDSFNPRKEPWYPLNRRLGGLQNGSRDSGEEKNLFTVPEFEPRTVQPVAQSIYTDYTTTALFTVRIRIKITLQTGGWMGPRDGLDALAKGKFVGRGVHRMSSKQFISTIPFEITHVRFQRHFINW